MDSYRQRKESFVSNLNGSTLFETSSVVINICATYFLCQIFKSRCLSNVGQIHSLFNFFVEYVILVIPLILISTILSSISSVFHVILWLVAFVIYLLPNKTKSTVVKDSRPASSSYSRVIEVFRGQIFIMTCVCILAVDFPIFPRRYAKTENLGYSGMDLGVGLFALAHGMVSSEARNKTTRWKDFILENAILFLLGIVRLISVKSVSYVEHVSEYGVHWNFFLTLCVMKSIGNLLMILTKNLWILIITVLTFHEVVLLRYLQYDLYLTSTSTIRANFLDANREGILSLGGYVSLYLIGVLLGRLVIDNERSKRFHFMSVIFFPAMIILCGISSNPSRKLCNFDYISSTTGMACMCLGSFSLIQWLLLRRSVSTESILLENVNQKGLDTFLLANVLTGLVNISIDTLDASSFLAMIILFLYLFVVTSFAYFSPSITKLIIKSFK